MRQSRHVPIEVKSSGGWAELIARKKHRVLPKRCSSCSFESSPAKIKLAQMTHDLNIWIDTFRNQTRKYDTILSAKVHLVLITKINTVAVNMKHVELRIMHTSLPTPTVFLTSSRFFYTISKKTAFLIFLKIHIQYNIFQKYIFEVRTRFSGSKPKDNSYKYSF